MATNWATSTADDQDGVPSNLRRVIAKQGLSLQKAAQATDVGERTLRSILHGKSRATSKTLHKIAAGLGVSVDELFATRINATAHAFDVSTNPIVAEVVASRPALFKKWKRAEYEELCSRFGVGGPLTEEGAVHFAKLINERREIVRKVLALFETQQRAALVGVVEGLYKSMEVRPLETKEACDHVSRPS